MKLLIDLPVDGERCGACPLADGVCVCPLFDEVIYEKKVLVPMDDGGSMRCPSCLGAEAEYKHRFGWKWTGLPELTGLSEKELDDLVKERAQKIVRLAFERSREGLE